MVFFSPKAWLYSGAALVIGLAAAPAWGQTSGVQSEATLTQGTQSEPAQTSGATTVADDELGQIVVTGSRIARPELEASTPVQVVGTEQIQSQGSPLISDILNELPAVGTGVTRTNTNFSTSGNGVATVNLRNMGASRTLVLINGRRVVAGLGGTSAVDLNNIPSDMVDRVEIITGGASAVYGSEAVAGVVNFVLRRNFEGFRVRGQVGMTDKADSDRYLVSTTAGANFADGRGNVTANVQYDKDVGLRSRDRSISREDVPFRSGFPAQGRFFVDDPNPTPGNDRSTQFTYNPANQLKEGFTTAIDGYNRNGDRFISVPLERWLFTAVGHYDINDAISFFAEGTLARIKSRSGLEPLATDNSDARLPDGTILPGLSLDNPFIPDPIRQRLVALGQDTLGFAKRLNNVFDRSNRADRDFYRFVVGFQGEMAPGWTWDVFFNQGRSVENVASETALRDRYYYALDAVAGPGGTPICRDATARAQGCVPFNPFGFNSASPESANYITNGGQLSTYEARIWQRSFGGNLAGTIATLPAGDAKLAAGVERRIERSSEVYDRQTQQGNTLSNALTNTIGRYSVSEAYAEAVVPVLADLPFVQSLTLEGAVRYADYSTVGGVWSWKAGGDWAPVEDFRLRAVYSRATRAPNISELFSGASQTFPTGLTDPCEGTTAATPGAIAAYCRSVPGIAAQIAQNGVFVYDDNADRQSIEGEDSGNPNLNEETARTWTIGGVLTPRAIPNFSLSVDWFQIKIRDAVTFLPRQVTIDECAASNGTSPLCDLIVREPVGTPRPRTPGTVFQVNSSPVNAGSIETRGIDVAARYAFDLGETQDAGRLGFALNYTYLDKLTLQPLAGLPVENNRGQLDGDGRLGAGFKHRANLTTTYTNGLFNVNWRVNYLGKIKDTLGPDADSPLGDETNSIGAFFYHDLQVRIALNEDRQATVYVGVDNLFNKKPPVINQNGASNVTGTETAADTYDPFGRFIYAGVELAF